MTNKFRIALLSMAAVGLVGCADKLADDVLQSSQEGATDGSVTFKISSVDNQTRTTRATDPETSLTGNVTDGFNKGEEYEYAITKDAGANVVFLFDEDGKYLSKSDLQVLSQPTELDDNDSHVDPEDDPSSEKGSAYHPNQEEEMYFNARIRKAKDGKPLQCIMILNAKPSRLSNLSNKLTAGSTTIDDFLTKYDEWEESSNPKLGQYTGSDNKTYFTMSNTVYVKGFETPGEVQCPITISENDIYTTAQEAKDHPVTVHVERLAAKFSLSYGGADGVIAMADDNILHTLASANPDEEVGEAKWAVKIVGWDVNGTETRIFWTKNLKLSSGNNVYGTDGKIGNWEYGYTWTVRNGWNDPSRVRSYWAVDPHYNNRGDRYPEQYRRILGVEEDEEHVTGIPTGSDKNVLNYIPYKDIATDGDYRYAPENTFDALGFMQTTDAYGDYMYIGDGYKRAATHILVAAELQLEKKIGEEKVLTTFDGYCYENIYWWSDKKDELLKYMARNVIDEYVGDVFVEVDGDKKNIKDANNYGEYFEFKENDGVSETNGATIKGGDGRVMLTLKEGAEAKLLVKGSTEGTYTGINTAALQKVIYTAGTAKHYNQGKMYYAIPIKHMAPISVVPEKNADGEDDVNADKTLYNTGSFGVVRNHWYRINITEIKVPGIPVDDPDQPIIPNDDPDEGGYIAFEIVIVPWHVIDQNVTFE